MKGFSLVFFMMICMVSFAQEYNYTVAKDGSGDFNTVQEAIDAVPHLRKERTLIAIKNGIYKEKLMLPSTKTNISFIGENISKTVLTYDDYASKKNVFGENIGTSGSSSFFIYGDGFTASNITFENSAGTIAQAVAVRVDGDRVKFENCRFLGNQDTLYTHGKKSRQYYVNCYIEGTVDFIFGSSTAYFQNCEIYCKTAGFITAASTLEDTDYGYVFNNCKITGSAEAETFYLGRPWRPFAQVAFINCDMSDIIKEEGWDPWGKEENKETTNYVEYKNTGKGAEVTKRVTWSKQLTEEQVAKYTIDAVFGDWKP